MKKDKPGLRKKNLKAWVRGDVGSWLGEKDESKAPPEDLGMEDFGSWQSSWFWGYIMGG